MIERTHDYPAWLLKSDEKEIDNNSSESTSDELLESTTDFTDEAPEASKSDESEQNE